MEENIDSRLRRIYAAIGELVSLGSDQDNNLV